MLGPRLYPEIRIRRPGYHVCGFARFDSQSIIADVTDHLGPVAIKARLSSSSVTRENSSPLLSGGWRETAQYRTPLSRLLRFWRSAIQLQSLTQIVYRRTNSEYDKLPTCPRKLAEQKLRDPAETALKERLMLGTKEQ